MPGGSSAQEVTIKPATKVRGTYLIGDTFTGVGSVACGARGGAPATLQATAALSGLPASRARRDSHRRCPACWEGSDLEAKPPARGPASGRGPPGSVQAAKPGGARPPVGRPDSRQSPPRGLAPPPGPGGVRAAAAAGPKRGGP